MKDRMYVRGDEVIDIKNDEGVVLGYTGEVCRVGYLTPNNGRGAVVGKQLETNLKPNLEAITKPFGLCGKAVQQGLKDAWNGGDGEDSNIEIYGSVDWFKQEPLWRLNNTYRLAKPEPKKNPEFITIEGAKYQLVEGEDEMKIREVKALIDVFKRGGKL